jgi:hypothetical protein
MSQEQVSPPEPQPDSNADTGLFQTRYDQLLHRWNISPDAQNAVRTHRASAAGQLELDLVRNMFQPTMPPAGNSGRDILDLAALEHAKHVGYLLAVDNFARLQSGDIDSGDPHSTEEPEEWPEPVEDEENPPS